MPQGLIIFPFYSSPNEAYLKKRLVVEPNGRQKTIITGTEFYHTQHRYIQSVQHMVHVQDMDERLDSSKHDYK